MNQNDLSRSCLLRNMTTAELLRYVDRGVVEVRELADRLEGYRDLLLEIREKLGEAQDQLAEMGAEESAA